MPSGDSVYGILASYGDEVVTGNDWMRIYQFRPDENIIRVRTYSTELDSFSTAPESFFDIDYNMDDPTSPLRVPFSIVALSESRFYTENGSHLFNQQLQWVVDNESAFNIKYVMHLGDLVGNGDSSTFAWEEADSAFMLLDQANGGLGIPYGICPGEQDQSPTGPQLFTTIFSISTWKRPFCSERLLW